MRDDKIVASNIEELIQKAESSLMPAIEEHMKSREFDPKKDALDFLEVKNSMLLSYMIDLTYHVRQRVSKKHDEQHLRRLHEMRTALDKTRPLEKKMRYQLDRLLAATATTTSFAAAADPLVYRPDPNALLMASDDNDSSDDDSDDETSHGEDSSREEEDDAMDDLAAAQATLERARRRRQQQQEEKDLLYRAPRLASVPYPKADDNSSEREKRTNRRLRTTELAQTLRAQYGEAPEQEDVHGGTEYGKQREAARRMAEREQEKTSFEEDNMMRLVTSRKERKDRQRLMREESSNLAAVADLGSLVRGVSSALQDDDGIDEEEGGLAGEHRYSNKKRRRSAVDESTGRPRQGRKSKSPKNAYQQALFGSSEGKSKKKR